GRRRDSSQLLRSHRQPVAALHDLREHAEIAPLDQAVLDESRREIDAEALLALEADVEEVDGLGVEITHERSIVGDRRLVDPEGLHENLPDAHPDLGAGPDLRRVWLHAVLSLLSA